jgi:methionyl-tRNA synthetase
MEGKAKKELLTKWLEDLQYIAFNLQPFLPETASKIDEATHGMIHRIEPIFPRL